VYFDMVEKYLSDYTQRWPPNLVGQVNAALIEAHRAVYRRYETNRMSVKGETFGDALVATSGANPNYPLRGYPSSYFSTTFDNDMSNVDGYPVALLAAATVKKKIGQPDADLLMAEYEKYMTDLEKRSPQGAEDFISECIRDAQEQLYRTYAVFRMERWYTWTMQANQRFYGIGSDDDASSSSPLVGPVSVYGPATANRMSKGRYAMGFCTLASGKGLMAGGAVSSPSPTNYTDIYDPATGMISATGKLNTARLRHVCVALQDGRALVAGGFPFLASAEIYDPSTGKWTTTGSMATGRQYFDAVTLQSGRVLVAGGQGSGAALASCELFDPSTGLWSAASPMNTARAQLRLAMLVDGRVIAVGGTNTAGAALSSAEIYDEDAGTWTNTAVGMFYARYQFGIASSAGNPTGPQYVLVSGGTTDGTTARGDAERYDPNTDSWSLTGSMNVPRMNHEMWLSLKAPPGGPVQFGAPVFVVAGGTKTTGNRAKSEYYNSTNNNWTAGGTMANEAAQAAVFNYAYNKVVVIGGTDQTLSTGTKNTAQIYDGTNFTLNGSLNAGTNYYFVTSVTQFGESVPLTSLSGQITGVPAESAVKVQWADPVRGVPDSYNIYRNSTLNALGAQYIGNVPASQNYFIDQGTIQPGPPQAPTTGNANMRSIDQRKVTWVGLSWNDTGWRSLARGVPPVDYLTTQTGIPHFYDIRDAIEIWPAPAQAGWFLRMKGFFGCDPFETDDDLTTIDWQAVYYLALAMASETYEPKSAPARHKRSEDYVGRLTAGTHMTSRYFPGAPPEFPPLSPPIQVP